MGLTLEGGEIQPAGARRPGLRVDEVGIRGGELRVQQLAVPAQLAELQGGWANAVP